MDNENYKEVYFSKYCPKCRYKDLPEIEDILDKDGNVIDKKKTVCYDCQCVSAVLGSHVPECFEEDK